MLTQNVILKRNDCVYAQCANVNELKIITEREREREKERERERERKRGRERERER